MHEVVKKIDEVFPNGYNPNVMDAEKYAALKELITRFGYLQPILIVPDGKIIDGEHRWRAMKDLGHSEIACVVFEHEGDIEDYRKLITVAMNSIRGEHDGEKLQALLNDIAFEIDIETITKMTAISDEKLHELVKDVPITTPDIDMAGVLAQTEGLPASYPLTAGNIRLNLTEEEYNRLNATYEAYVERYKVDMGFVFYLLGVDA
mgnify:FL=1